MKIPRYRAALFTLAASLVVGGCASHRPTTLNEQQFIQTYDDQTTYNLVAYMGSDDTYDYFCMEHVTPKGDTDVTVDKKVYYRAAMADHRVKNPFPLTYDENQWRVMRPKG